MRSERHVTSCFHVGLLSFVHVAVATQGIQHALVSSLPAHTSYTKITKNTTEQFEMGRQPARVNSIYDSCQHSQKEVQLIP